MAADLLIGQAPSAEAAARLALQYSVCPHVHFIAAYGTMVVGVWYLPDEKRWWLKLVAEHPQVTLGLLRAAVYHTEDTAYPETALRPVERCEGPLSPCGSDCSTCDHASASDDAPCGGCPALDESA